MLDPRGVVTKMRTEDDEEGIVGPADAPTTIALGEAIEPGQKETFVYRPDLGEVPLISLPDTLPDLLGMYLSLLLSTMLVTHLLLNYEYISRVTQTPFSGSQ